MHGFPKARRMISLGFAGEEVPEGLHICYIFNDESERRRVVARFLESGILAGEKVLCAVDAMTPGEMRGCLEELGVDTGAGGALLRIEEAAKICRPRGVFDIGDMLASLRDFHREAVEVDGRPGSRISGEMTWCLREGGPDEAAVLEYEARINDLVQDYPFTSCCHYDARKFSGGMIMDVLTVHPVMIVRGQLVKNPFYVEPKVFLREFLARTRGERRAMRDGETA